jgi:signal transduction histidine kinase
LAVLAGIEVRHFAEVEVMSSDPVRYDSAAKTAEVRLVRNSIKHLSGRLMEAQEQEKVHIGKELHDDVCQSLAVLGYELDRLLETLPAKAQLRVRGISEQIRQLTNHINKLSNQLHSLTLKELGLPVALRTLCSDLADNCEISVQCRCSPVSPDLDARVALTLFRAAQEAIRNIRQHSQARHVSIELISDANEILLRVSDDGVGFNPVVDRGDCVGLASTEERLESIGGSLLVRSARGQGTVIEARCPVTTSA